MQENSAWQLSIQHPQETWFEPCHEIMVLFVLRKLILQTLMRSHPVGLHVREQQRLWPEPSLVAYVISTIISWAGSFSQKVTFSNASRILTIRRTCSNRGHSFLSSTSTGGLLSIVYIHTVTWVCKKLFKLYLKYNSWKRRKQIC